VGDTTDKGRWVDLLCYLPHCDTAVSRLTNDTLTTFIRVLNAMMTDAGRHRPSAARSTTPAVRSVGVVYYAVFQFVCRSSYFSLVTFSVSYYVAFFIFPSVPLSISLDTVLSHNYRTKPVTNVIFWFQSCLLINSINSKFSHRLTAE